MYWAMNIIIVTFPFRGRVILLKQMLLAKNHNGIVFILLQCIIAMSSTFTIGQYLHNFLKNRCY